MSTLVLIHGAGDGGWYWHLVEAALRARGHDVVAPDLPADDESAGLEDYADVGQHRLRRGGSGVGRAWWRATGNADPYVCYYHDVPRQLAEEAMSRERDHPSEASTRAPWPLATGAHRVRAVHRGPLPPATVHAPGGGRAAAHRPGRDRRRSLRRAQPARRAGGHPDRLHRQALTATSTCAPATLRPTARLHPGSTRTASLRRHRPVRRQTRERTHMRPFHSRANERTGLRGSSSALGEPCPSGSPTHVHPRPPPRGDGWVPPLWWTGGLGQAVPSHLRLCRTRARRTLLVRGVGVRRTTTTGGVRYLGRFRSRAAA